MIVFRFAGFAASFSKRMTGERLGVRMIPPLWFYVKGRANGGVWQLPRLKKVIYI